MPEFAALTVLTDEVFGTVSPRLYGHFAEHLGRCCYDGIWVGRDSTIPNWNGFRLDVLNALKAMPTPLLRWPGGCYADHYHWGDGIGPSRPVRLGMSCGLQVEDDNGLGTHEFLDYCKQIGAEAYLAGNMGSGSVQEMCDWLEYCNASVQTELVKERTSNGHADPYGVKLWGVGNENWGCGGHYDADSYGLEYRRYATMLQHVDPNAELVTCGHNKEWNERLMDKLRHHAFLVDHFSIHRYWVTGGPGVKFSDEQYYKLLREADETEDFVMETRAIIQDAVGDKKKIGIALDEWGVWHPEVRQWGEDAVGGDLNNYEQACTLRDALAACAAFEGFHRQADSLSMANIAQIVNVLQAPIRTEGDAMWLTPTYHAFAMHEPHLGGQAVRVSVEGGLNLPDGSPAVTATATTKDSKIAVTIMNRHLHEEAAVRIPVGGTVKLLTSGRASDENGPDSPDRVALQDASLAPDGDGWVLELPPHSVATVA